MPSEAGVPPAGLFDNLHLLRRRAGCG